MIRRRASAFWGLLLALLLTSADAKPGQGAGPQPARAAAERPAPAAEGRASSALPGGALDDDCSHVADGLGGPGYQFIDTCPGTSRSPDGRFAVVQKGTGDRDEQADVFLSDGKGDLLDEIPNLADHMPFVLFWSSRSDWFFVNHYLGSSQDRLRVFEIVNGTAIERSAVFAEATREMVRRFPCLGRGASVVASGWRWSRDGRRIAMIVYARPDACGHEDEHGNWRTGPGWDPLWMIGDAETGRIDPASVRVRRNGLGPMPKDGPYPRL
ncbi:MAG TPA: hypothetical protein VF727_06090 [Allosphingosinicella sp.]|jgi:hypothetical protein